jgi:hypothetical protein
MNDDDKEHLDFFTASYSIGPHPKGGNLRSVIAVQDGHGKSYAVGSFYGLEKDTLESVSRCVVYALQQTLCLFEE